MQTDRQHGVLEDILSLYHTIPTFNTCENRKLLKTLWEKEKMLVTSIFSISHNVFYSSQMRIQIFYWNLFCCLQMLSIWISLKNLSFGKELNSFGEKKVMKNTFFCLPHFIRQRQILWIEMQVIWYDYNLKMLSIWLKFYHLETEDKFLPYGKILDQSTWRH